MFGRIILLYSFISLIYVKLVQSLPFVDYGVVRVPLIDWSQLKKDPSATKSSSHFPLKIQGKEYLIALRQRPTIFTSDAIIVVHEEKRPKIIKAGEFQTEPVIGYIVNHPNSQVRGYIDDGMFNGVIQIDDNQFFAESANKYLDNARNDEVIIYQNTAGDEDILPIHKYDTDDTSNLKPDYCKQSRNYSQSFCKIDKHNYHPYYEHVDHQNHIVSSFSGDFSEATTMGHVCKMEVVGDHYFVRNLNNGDITKAIKNMEYHMMEADKMFRVTDFDRNGSPDDIRVRVAKVVVFRSPSDQNYLLAEPNTNASYYLDKFSFYDHDEMCGALAFSGRLFPEGTLGYAYRGGPNKLGGICYRRRKIQDRNKSLNVGMVTLIGEHGRVPIQQSSVVVTHEMGHMFGSPHDDDMEGGRCLSPYTAKHYIMSSISNPGTTDENRRFSSCSINMIYANLRANGGCLVCQGKQCSGCINGMKISFSYAIVSIFIFVIVYRF